jgi:hypothetical protein
VRHLPALCRERQRWKKFRSAALDFREIEAAYHPTISGSGKKSARWLATRRHGTNDTKNLLPDIRYPISLTGYRVAMSPRLPSPPFAALDSLKSKRRITQRYRGTETTNSRDLWRHGDIGDMPQNPCFPISHKHFQLSYHRCRRVAKAYRSLSYWRTIAGKIFEDLVLPPKETYLMQSIRIQSIVMLLQSCLEGCFRHLLLMPAG